MCDTSSYTSDSGGKSSLEHIFEDINTSNELKLNEKLRHLMSSISELINENNN